MSELGEIEDVISSYLDEDLKQEYMQGKMKKEEYIHQGKKEIDRILNARVRTYKEEKGEGKPKKLGRVY